MNARLIIPALCAVLAVAGVAAVMILRGSDSDPVVGITDRTELDRIGTQALALVAYDPTKLGYAIRFEPGRPGVRAQLDRSSRAISVFLRRGDLPHVVAHDIAHELGHAYDKTRMDEGARSAYLTSRGVPTAAWNTSGDSDYAVGAGDFAEVFALCHAASPDFRSELAPRPATPCELLPTGAR